jgi:acyl carrier protein
MVRRRVRQLMGEVFGVAPEALSDNPSPDELTQWDSAHHLELLLCLEEEFGVEVPTDDIAALVSLDALVAFLERQRVPEATGAAGDR